MEKIILKKSRITILCLCLIFSLVTIISAQENKISIELTKEIFPAGENITLKVLVYNEQSQLIDDNVDLVIQDAQNLKKIEKTISTKQLAEIDLGENAPHGFWTIQAKYNEAEATANFNVEVEELAEFSIQGNILKIKNMGNSKYSRNVQIVIGQTVGVKQPELEIGEEIEYRLVAPEGKYNIKVSDGKTTITKSDVALTGNAIGILNEQISERSGLTGGIKPDQDQGLSWEYLKRSKFTYIFILAIFGAMILLAIERRYKRKTH